MLKIFNKKPNMTVSEITKYALQKTKDAHIDNSVLSKILTEKEKNMLTELAQSDTGAAIFYAALLGICNGIDLRK